MANNKISIEKIIKYPLKKSTRTNEAFIASVKPGFLNFLVLDEHGISKFLGSR